MPSATKCRGEGVISADNSPVKVRVIPPAEDLIIVNHVVRLMGAGRFKPIQTNSTRILRCAGRSAMFYTEELIRSVSSCMRLLLQ